MSNMYVGLELLESNAEIAKKILLAIAEDFNHLAVQKIPEIKRKVALAVINHIKNTDTYDSLINGDLAGHFGLPASIRQGMINNILNTIAAHTLIEYKPVKVFSSSFVGGMTINVVLANFSDILDMAESFVYTERGQDLPWLRWLLLEGDAIIISEHEVHLIGGKGRSGRGIMVKNNASVWRVPPKFAGTIGNNWLTRAFLEKPDVFLNQVGIILKEELA